MNKKKWALLALLILFSVWAVLPLLLVTIPYTEKEITLKPEEIKVSIFGKELNFQNKIRLGLDLQGGSHLLFLLDTNKLLKENVTEATNAARDIIEKRVNFFGVAEPQIFLLKDGQKYKVSVDLAGNKNPQEAIKLIGRTVQLDFREYQTKKVQQGTESAVVPYFVPSKLTGQYLKKATLVFDQQTGKPQISLLFDEQGKKIFATLTKKNIKKPLAIFLDNQLLTAPVVQQEIKDGKAVITGEFSIEEAKELVNSLNAGALPVPIKLLEQKTVEATLGKENVQKSLFAGVIGLLSVVVFMVGVYRKEGVVAGISLGLYALFSLALYKLLGIVLTMSGIAGFILSVGMAVDANILIYERIKEEKRKINDQPRAVRTGFFRALSAIKSANINTLLICLILFNPFNFAFLPQFGAVRGFALTLALGVILGLFTGVFITKNILWKIYKIE